MKNKIWYSPEAETDLEQIWDYLLSELASPQAAEQTITQILDTVDSLEDFSKRGTPLSAVTDVESGYRFLLSGPYIVFYRIEKDAIYIDRILHEKQDFLRILFSDLE